MCSPAARADPVSAGAGDDAAAVEGCMIKRADSPYVPGRPKGLVVQVEARPAHHRRRADVCPARPRQAFLLLLGLHLRRVARGPDGDELVPVGKAYFGFTDEELIELDRFVRRNTINRFGPVREVAHEAAQGLVLEVAFEGLNRSTRHKSGVAMRFPRISRIRWDKPPAEADRLETLERLIRPHETEAAAERRPDTRLARRTKRTNHDRAHIFVAAGVFALGGAIAWASGGGSLFRQRGAGRRRPLGRGDAGGSLCRIPGGDRAVLPVRALRSWRWRCSSR